MTANGNLRAALIECLAAICIFVSSRDRVYGADTPRKPNLIVIVADDLGYADLSCYGNNRFHTPHLDALAASGLRFTDFHSNGPVCSPTRAALMTARYQQRSGVDEVVYADPAKGLRDDFGLKTSEVTFSRLLGDAGYVTGIFGKWHLGYAKKFNPCEHGFHQFRGYLSGNVDYQSHYDQAGFLDWWRDREVADEPGYTTDLITKHAVTFIEENKNRPFCLYVPHEASHAPYQGPSDPPVRGPNASKPVAAAEIPRAYREMVEAMDRGVGEITATLKRLGLEENTLVFFCSDNGGTREANNGPLYGFKGSVWEGGHRVAGIVSWPGTIAAGTSTDQTAMTMDVLPTLVELGGATISHAHKLDGTSLVALLKRFESLTPRTLFWGYTGKYAVRQGPWKLVENQPREGGKGKKAAAAAPMLFNLADDLGEANDLINREPRRAQELQQLLSDWRRDVESSSP